MGIENVDYAVASRWNEATRTKEHEKSLVEKKPFDISTCIAFTEKAIIKISEVYHEYPIKQLYDARMFLDSALRRLKELPQSLNNLDNA